MGSAKITFPVIGTERGITTRRNAETGVEIRSTKLDRGGMEHTVYAPMRGKQVGSLGNLRLINYFETLAGAREEAMDRAQELREQIAEAYSDAITENAKRAIAKYAATEPPATAATIIGRIPLHARAGLVAQMIGYADTARTPADAVKFAQAALDLYEAEDTVPADAVAPAPAPYPATLPEGVELIEFGQAEPSSYVYMLSGVHVESMPKMEIVKRPRERAGRGGYRLAGWSVRIGGVEIDRAARKADARTRLDRWLASHLRKLGSAVEPERELPPLKTIDARPRPTR